MFVIISTIIFYIILRSYKTAEEPNNKKSNKFMYLVLLPVILYTGEYFYSANKNVTPNLNINIDDTHNIIQDMSEDLLSAPYPASTISSSIES